MSEEKFSMMREEWAAMPVRQPISGHYVTGGIAASKTYPDGRCAECGGSLAGEPERAEVVNPTTGERGVVHGSCFLANDDELELA